MEKFTNLHRVNQQTLKCQVCQTDVKERLRWMGEGREPAAWTHSNLNAAEVSVTRRLVCGYQTDRASTFLSCLCRQRQRAAPFMVRTAIRPAVTWASTPLLFSVPDPSSPRTCLVFLPRRPDWAAAICSPLSPTHCVCDSSSGWGGYPRIFHCHQESCGKWVIRVAGRKPTLTFPEKDVLISKSTLLN